MTKKTIPKPVGLIEFHLDPREVKRRVDRIKFPKALLDSVLGRSRPDEPQLMTKSEVAEIMDSFLAAYGWTGELPKISQETLYRLKITAERGALRDKDSK